MATPLIDMSGNETRAHTRPHQSGGLGEMLRRAREHRGLTIEQVANETKIPQRHLEALENGNLEFVPGEFYQRAEIRTYARTVNLDQTVVSAELARMLELRASETIPEPPKSASPWQSKRVLIGIGIGAIVTVSVTGGAMWRRAAALDARVRGATDSQPNVAPAREVSADAVVGTSQRTQPAVAEMAPAIAPSITVEPVGAAAPASPAPETPIPAPSADPIPAPAEPQAAAASTTTLVVKTEPEGARVTVNGIGWGAAPVTIRHLSAGDKHIRVSQDGYITEERVVPVASGRTKVLDIQLRSIP